MKKIILIFSIVLFIFGSQGCVVKKNANGDVPPGQVKKMTGEKSAKKYAPGQKKKTQHL